jgi:hypothetical protein
MASPSKSFNKISDFMDRYYVDPRDRGPRKGSEYRGALRNAARLAYRLAKRTVKDIEKQKTAE